MSSVQEHFGIGADPSVITPDTLHGDGTLRCCVGVNKSPGNKWFGINGVEPNHLSFCEYCSHNGFSLTKVFEITDENYPGLKLNLVCDSSRSKFIKPYVGERRCVNYNGIKVNVNLVNKYDNIWRPVMKMTSDKAKRAEADGVLLAKIPTMSYWEFVVQGDEDEQYYNGNYYFKVKGEFGDKRTITKADQNGNTNFYTPMKGQLRINGYNSGYGNRFFFQAPSQLEIDNGIEADHNNDSNKLVLTIEIYEKITIKSVNTFSGYNNDEEPVYRGGPSKSKSLTGGSNFGTHGYSSNATTRVVNASFNLVKTFNMIIQLVNNESEDQKLHMSQIIQSQVDEYKEKEIERLILKRDDIDKQIEALRTNTSVRSNVLGVQHQMVHLV